MATYSPCIILLGGLPMAIAAGTSRVVIAMNSFVPSPDLTTVHND